MSQTPGKMQVTNIKLSKVQKTQKVTTTYRALQTDRKPNDKVKSPLMLLLLLKKKFRNRLEQAFLKMYMHKSKHNSRKIIAKYMTSILNFKIKFNQAAAVHKLQINLKRKKNFKSFASGLGSWLNNKLKNHKLIAWNNIKVKAQKNQLTTQEEQPKNENLARNQMRDSKAATTLKKPQVNRSLDSGNKSLSSSKQNLVKKLDFDKEDNLPAQIQKIKKQNQQLTIMELSEEARQALKKVQRFDRFMYAQETEKICKEVLTNQLKRLQKIKNSQKQMRGQFYDNQLTITALHNHIKLISEMNRDMGDLSKLKQTYEKQQARRKQQQFRANLENKRSKNKSVNLQTQVKQIMQSIQTGLSNKDYQKVRQDLNTAVTKYEKQQLMKEKIVLYKALLQTINNSKDLEKGYEDLNKISQNLKSIDYSQIQTTVRSLKSGQKQFNLILNKYSKQQKNHEKQVFSILQSYQIFNNNFLKHTQSLNTKIVQPKVMPTEQIKKSIKTQGNQLDNNLKNEYDNMIKARKQFEKRVSQILQKSQNKIDFKRDLDLLHKDKIFVGQKPYSDFFSLEQVISISLQQQIEKQIQSVNSFLTLIIQSFKKQKIKSEMRAKDITRIIDNLVKKNPKLTQLAKNVEELITSVNKKIEEEIQQQKSKRIKTETLSIEKPSPQDKRKNRVNSEQAEDTRPQIPKPISKQKNEIMKLKEESQKKIQQIKAQFDKQKQQKNKLQKQLTVLKQTQKNIQVGQKKILDIIQKMRKNQDWATQLENIKRDRTLLQSKNVQLALSFYENVNDQIKKSKSAPLKIEKCLALILKLIERKNLTQEKKTAEIQKIYDQTFKADPHLQQIIKLVIQWGKNIQTLCQQSYLQQLKKQGAKDQSQKKITQLSTENKKLNDSIQTQRSKSKSLNEKIKQFEKSTREQTQKIASLEKQKKQKQQSGKKPVIPQPKSQETIKLQSQLKQSKQKIVLLQKQIQTLKNNEKKQKQLSEKKASKNEQNQQLKNQVSRLQNQLSNIKEKLSQQNNVKSKDLTLKNQAQKSIATISITLQAKDYKQLQLQANKLSKTFQQDQRFSDLASLIENLIQILIDRQNKQKKKKIQFGLQSQNKDKEKIDILTKIVKQSEPQIKNGVYLTNNDYWDKFLVGADPRTTSILRDFIRILKLLTTQIKIKAQRFEQISQKNKQESNLINNLLEVLRNVEVQANKKQFLNSDQCWTVLETTLNFDDRVTKGIFKSLKKISQVSRAKLDSDRKSSQKTIKSYEKELQKMNNLISQYDIKIKQKDNQYQQLYKTFSQLQKQGVDERRSTSLRTSRKSVRSNSSDKDKQSQMKTIKASMQAFAEQQRNMLQKLNASENQKFILSEKITALQRDLNSSFRTIQQLRSTIKNLQKSVSDEHANYQRQYEEWRQKSINNNKEINDLRAHYEKQFEKKQEKLVQQFDSLTKQRQLALEKYHRDLVNVQNQLNNQIDLLKEQLRQKNVDTNKLEEYEILKRKYTQTEVQYMSVKTRLGQYQSKTSAVQQEYLQLQNVIKQNGQLQVQISNLTNKNRQLQLEIQNMKKQLQISRQTQHVLSQKVKIIQIQKTTIEQKTVHVAVTNNSQARVLQLEEQIAKFIKQRDQVITNEVNLALQHQQKDFNLFLDKHDQQIQAHFFNIVIPERIREALQANRINPIEQTHQVGNLELQRQLNQQIKMLKQANTSLKQQYEHQYRMTVENQGKIDDQIIIIRDLERKFDEQLKKTKTLLSELEQRDQRLNIYEITQEQIKKYLHIFQISWEEAITGVVSQNVSKLYLRPQIVEPRVVEVVKQVFIVDPNQESIMNQLRFRLDQLSRINRDLQVKLNNQVLQKQRILQAPVSVINTPDYKLLEQNIKKLQFSFDDLNKKYTLQIQSNGNLRTQLNASKALEDELKHQIRRVQSSWETKLYDQARSYDVRILQLTQKPQSPTIPTKSLAEYRELQGRFQDLNRRYNDQVRQRSQWENKYTQISTLYERKLTQIGNQGINQTSILNKQIGILKDQNNQLSLKLNQKDRLLKQLQESLRKQLKDQQNILTKRLQQRINHYERKLTQNSNQISNLKIKSQTLSSNTIHLQCDSRYRQLQNKSFKQISDLKIKQNQTSKSARDQIDLLKQIINNQKIELKQLQLMVNNLRQNKQQAQKQKQAYFNQLKTISTQKDRQIFKLRSQYQTKLTTLSIQKSTLQTKLNNTLQSTQNTQLISSRHYDNNNHLKIIQLQSILNTKIVQIKHLQQINQRKRRQLDQQHHRLITIQRQRQHLRLNAHNMQTHIMRLQSDISTLSNQLQKYKFALTEFQSRQAVLRNDIIRFSGSHTITTINTGNTGNDIDNSYQLKQQIGALKDQIIKITTTNAQQIQQLHIQQRQQFDNIRIKKMLRDIQIHRSSQKYGNYDQGQLQLIKRINQQVTQLVAANRNLQTRITLLQSQLEIGDKFGEKMDIFIYLQDKMEVLINYLLERLLLNNTDDYSKFMYTSRELLNAQDIQGYFNNWLNFMKSLFITITELKSQQLRHKAEEMIELKEQMNQILDKHIEYAEDENYQTLDKYKLIFSDIKILLREFMNSRNEEYIQMIWRSLEPHEGQV